MLLIASAIGAFALLDGPGLGDRNGPPVEELAVERTVLKPGEIKLSVRNDGPDEVVVSQVIVNDGFADFSRRRTRSGGSRPPTSRCATRGRRAAHTRCGS